MIDKYSKLKSKGAKLLNDLPTISELENTDDIEMQSMIEKTAESVYTIDTSFVDGGTTNQLPEREMKAFDKEVRRIGGVLKLPMLKK